MGQRINRINENKTHYEKKNVVIIKKSHALFHILEFVKYKIYLEGDVMTTP